MKLVTRIHLHLIITFIFLLFTFIFSIAQSNMPIQWQGCYGGFDRDYATDMVETDNGYMIIGTIYSDDGDISNSHGSLDIWIINIDSTGNLIWERAYGGSNPDYEGRIMADMEGNYYFCGTVSSNDGDVQSGNHGVYDAWIVKIDGSGEILWEKCYGGSGHEEPTNIKLLNNGNIMITSNTTSDDGDLPAHYGAYDAWLFVISPEGEILKNAVFGNDLHNNIFDAIETQDEGYFFTCQASSTNGMVEGVYHGGMLDVWVVKLDNNMDIEWQMLYGGSETDYGFWGIHEISDGYLFLALTNSNDWDVSGFHGGFNDIWAVRIDFQGNIIWQRCLGGSDYESAGDLFQTEDEGFVIFGETKSNNGDVSGNHSYPNWGWSDIWMVKLSSEGVLEWQQCYGSYGDDKVYGGVIQKSDYNWVIAGSAGYNSDDVNCNLHGEYVEDYWVFEIKDTTIGIFDTPATQDNLMVYPNPAKDYVVFELSPPFVSIVISNPGMGHSMGVRNPPSITITNIFGQEVAQLPVKTEKTVWNTRMVKEGIYFYNIEIEGNLVSGKVVVQK